VVKPMDFHPGNYLLVHAGEARRGRPDCSACHRYESFCVGLRELDVEVTTGVFGARMSVEVVNDGPVTIVLGA